MNATDKTAPAGSEDIEKLMDGNFNMQVSAAPNGAGEASGGKLPFATFIKLELFVNDKFVASFDSLPTVPVLMETFEAAASEGDEVVAIASYVGAKLTSQNTWPITEAKASSIVSDSSQRIKDSHAAHHSGKVKLPTEGVTKDQTQVVTVVKDHGKWGKFGRSAVDNGDPVKFPSLRIKPFRGAASSGFMVELRYGSRARFFGWSKLRNKG